ncbi:MAG TPA: 50S ribosomal protein L22 [Anaerohalosphaeraceae bacterium]|nr:50S ribosomal protein L22 [Anaerohalosphaeraceae bacterium]
MLSSKKFTKLAQQRSVSVQTLADHLARGGMDKDTAVAAVKNWQKGLFTPKPGKQDVERLAGALGVNVNEISEWKSSYNYAPMSPRKVRLVTSLISGRDVQDAIDILTFTRKRAAEAVRKTLKAAIANADENEADMDNLVVSEIRVDGAGRRIGTKGFRAKDRGRAHAIRKEASHIHVTVSEF